MASRAARHRRRRRGILPAVTRRHGAVIRLRRRRVIPIDRTTIHAARLALIDLI